MSECSEGMGSPEYVASQRRFVEEGSEAFLASIAAQAHAQIDEWQTQMLTKPQARGQIKLYTQGLSRQDRSLTGVELIDDVADAINRSCARHGSRALAVIPEGPYVVPRVA